WQGAVIGGIVAGLNHAMHEIDSPLDDDGGGDGPVPKKKNNANERSGSNQDKRLSPGEIKKLKDAGWDHSEKGVNGKGGGQKDLWKDKNGNVYEKPKNGKGPGEPIGVNLNNLSVKVGVGAAILGGGLKLLDYFMSRAMPVFMVTPFMMQQSNPNYYHKQQIEIH
ncbi:toxin 33, partial [Cruoricaptor ignavus]